MHTHTAQHILAFTVLQFKKKDASKEQLFYCLAKSDF